MDALYLATAFAGIMMVVAAIMLVDIDDFFSRFALPLSIVAGVAAIGSLCAQAESGDSVSLYTHPTQMLFVIQATAFCGGVLRELFQ